MVGQVLVSVKKGRESGLFLWVISLCQVEKSLPEGQYGSCYRIVGGEEIKKPGVGRGGERGTDPWP